MESTINNRKRISSSNVISYKRSIDGHHVRIIISTIKNNPNGMGNGDAIQQQRFKTTPSFSVKKFAYTKYYLNVAKSHSLYLNAMFITSKSDLVFHQIPYNK